MNDSVKNLRFQSAGAKPPFLRGGLTSGLRSLALLIAILALLVPPRAARGEPPQLPTDFLRPSLVLNGQGHTGTLRVLTFSEDGTYLVSAGLDKVVRVWEFLDGHPRLDKTIRPPVRRLGGAIYAAALGAPDPQNQRLLAVAGIGPIGNGGDILVYRIPGKFDAVNGDLAFVLELGSMEGPGKKTVPPNARRGHVGAVYGLAYSPDNRFLASCGQDTTIRIWDLQAVGHPSVATLEGHRSWVRCVAFVDNDRLISASGGFYQEPNGVTKNDGTLRVWAWKNTPPLLVDEFFIDNASPINAMAVSVDRGTVIIGRENGQLARFSTSNLRDNKALKRPNGRAVEAVAISPDGRSFAASALKNAPAAPGELKFPLTDCEILIRSLDDGHVIDVARVTSDLARALAFSPKDGRFLAIGGGGSQEVAIKEVNNPNTPVVELKVPSSTLWNVGFLENVAADSKPTVAYSRARLPDERRPPWEAIDLPNRQFVAVNDPTAVASAIKAVPGWSISASGTAALVATPAGGGPVPMSLAPTEDGRWTSYTFIPGNREMGHPKLAVAIGCTGGTVLLYSLPDGKKTRVFLGHWGPVYAIAPSPDGRWLASAGGDMTVRLWPLAGCDSRPALGATLERDAQGNWIVRKVGVQSFAQEIGLGVGDRVVKVSQRMVANTSLLAGTTIMADVQGKNIVTAVANSSPAHTNNIRIGDRVEISEAGNAKVVRELALERLDTEIDAIEPGTSYIDVDVPSPTAPAPVAGGAAGADLPAPATFTLATTRKDRPALSFMPGSDKEWIVWMPEGYYDTSIAGDRRLLGWHINKVVATPVRFVPLASEFYPMSRFAGQLHKPAVINRLLQTGDVVEGQGAVVVEPPPTIRIVQPANVVPGAELVVPQPTLTLRVESVGGSPNRSIKSISVHNNTIAYQQTLLDRPAPRAEATHEIKLVSNENAISVVATDDLGVEQIARIRVRLELPPAPPANAPGPRLLIRSVGIDKFDDAKAIKPILFARTDAVTLADFLEAPDTRKRFDRIDKPILASGRTTSEDLARVFESLSNEVRARTLGAGDTVFLAIETHLIKRGPKGLFFLGSDANLQNADQAAIEANTISHCLEEVAAAGCLVFVLLDGIHERELSIAATPDITAWVRQLNRRQVFVLVASKQEISQRPAKLGMSAFVRAIKDSVTVAGGSRSGAKLTVDQFRIAVIHRVAELTERSQYADLYPPDILDEQLDRIRLFEPQGRAGDRLAATGVNGQTALRRDEPLRPAGTVPTERRPQ
jgi:WD40 repeat protein